MLVPVYVVDPETNASFTTRALQDELETRE